MPAPSTPGQENNRFLEAYKKPHEKRQMNPALANVLNYIQAQKEGRVESGQDLDSQLSHQNSIVQQIKQCTTPAQASAGGKNGIFLHWSLF